MRTSLSFLCLVLLGCNSTGLAPSRHDAEPGGEFRYAASSLDGELLLLGWMNLEVRPDSTMVGRWSIRWAPGADTTVEVGDQVGNGTLRGRLTENGTYLDLNPGYADNNVILRPIPVETGFAGSWYWSTLSGPRTQGRFTAVRP